MLVENVAKICSPDQRQTGPAEAFCVLQSPVALLFSVSAVAKQPPFLSKDSEIICKYNVPLQCIQDVTISKSNTIMRLRSEDKIWCCAKKTHFVDWILRMVDNT